MSEVWKLKMQLLFVDNFVEKDGEQMSIHVDPRWSTLIHVIDAATEEPLWVIVNQKLVDRTQNGDFNLRSKPISNDSAAVSGRDWAGSCWHKLLDVVRTMSTVDGAEVIVFC